MLQNLQPYNSLKSNETELYTDEVCTNTVIFYCLLCVLYRFVPALILILLTDSCIPLGYKNIIFSSEKETNYV